MCAKAAPSIVQCLERPARPPAAPGGRFRSPVFAGHAFGDGVRGDCQTEASLEQLRRQVFASFHACGRGCAKVQGWVTGTCSAELRAAIAARSASDSVQLHTTLLVHLKRAKALGLWQRPRVIRTLGPGSARNKPGMG